MELIKERQLLQGLEVEPTTTLNSLFDPHLVCDACKRSYPVTEKSVCLTRWAAQLNTNNPSLVSFEHGSVVTSICWRCVENAASPPSTVSCYKPPLFIREHFSIVKYMLLSKKRNRLNPSAKFPPFCMNCHMSITEGSLCVYSRLTTEHDVDQPMKNKRMDEQNVGPVLDHEVVDAVRFFARKRWDRIAIKIENPIDIGITCYSCSIKLWGIDFSTTQK